MATTLLEKRFLEYNEGESPKVDADGLFISYYVDTPEAVKAGKKVELKTKKLSELFVREKVKSKIPLPQAIDTIEAEYTFRPVKDYAEYKDLYPTGEIYYSEHKSSVLKDAFIIAGNIGYKNATHPVYASFEVDKQYSTITDVEHTKIVEKKPIVTESNVPYGLERTAKVQENEPTSKDNYLMVHFEDSSKQDFVQKSKIYYKDGDSIVYLYELGKSINFNRVKGKTLYYENRILDDLYTEKEYTFGTVTKFEKLDADKMEKSSYELIENPTEADKNLVATGQVQELDGLFYKKKSSKTQDQYYSEAEQVTLNVVKENNKVEQESYYAHKVYVANKYGEYVNLRIKGDNKVSMINVDELVDENGVKIGKSDIKRYVGKSIKIKTKEGQTLDTEPITYEQAVYFYEKQYNYEQSLEQSDILADNSYLQTKNGEFVKESLVKPISYAFTNDEQCDAYLLHIKTANGIESKVVSAKEYKQATKNLKIEKAFRLKTTDFNNAQVVQTSNNNTKTSGVNVSECKVLCNYDSERNVFEDIQKQDKEAIQQGILDEFKQSYTNGNYFAVNYVYDENGNKIELKEPNKRFVYSDKHYMKDYAGNLIQYLGLKNSTVSYEYEKGKLGKFKGDAKVDFKKACSKAYGVWAKALVTYLAACVQPIGILASLAMPFVVSALGVALVVAPAVIPFVVGAVCLDKNVLKKKFKNKTNFNRKQWNKDIEKELEFINENMKGTKFAKGFSKDAFMQRMQKLKLDSLASCQATVGNGFKVVDGKVEINGENVNQVKDFKKTHKKELDDLKAKKRKLTKLEEKMKKAFKPYEKLSQQGIEINIDDKKYKKYLEIKKAYDDYKEIYTKQEEKFNRNVTNRNDEALTYSKDENVDKNLKQIENLKNFWMLKKFTSEAELKNLGFTEEQIKRIDEIEYDAKKNVLKTKSGEIKLEDLAEKKAEKVKEKPKKEKDKKKVKEKDKKVKEPSKKEKEKQETLEFLKKYKSAMETITKQDEEKLEADLIAKENERLARDEAEKLRIAEEERLKKEQAKKLAEEEKKHEKPVKEIPNKKEKDAKKSKMPFNAKINSEKALSSLLSAKTSNAERKKVIDYISEKIGEKISESDISETLERIEEKHDSSSKEGKTATSGAQRLKNKKIYGILIYGQQYITELKNTLQHQGDLNSNDGQPNGQMYRDPFKNQTDTFTEDIPLMQ